MKRWIPIAAVLVLLAAGAYAASETVYRPANSWTNAYTTSNTIDHTSIGDRISARVNPVTVRLMSTTDAFIAFAVTAPEASATTGMVLPAYVPEYIKLSTSDFLAVKASETAGVLHATEMTQ